MYAVVRRWSGASALIDELERNRQDVESMITGVPGFSAYYALRAADGLTTITVCQDQRGAEESTRRATAWVKEKLPSLSASAPEVAEGEVLLSFSGSSSGSKQQGSEYGAQGSFSGSQGVQQPSDKTPSPQPSGQRGATDRSVPDSARPGGA